MTEQERRERELVLADAAEAAGLDDVAEALRVGVPEKVHLIGPSEAKRGLRYHLKFVWELRREPISDPDASLLINILR